MSIQRWINRAQQQLDAFDVEKIKATGILPDQGKKFFPVIGYPPLTMFNRMDQTPLFKEFSHRQARSMIAYVHIPFCPSRCTFCHWITNTKSKAEEVDVYLDYIEKEMVLYKKNLGYDAIPVESVLIGGGTPTYLTPKQMARFLAFFTKHFDLSGCTQFSMEAEPKTLLGQAGLEKLTIMKEYGVQRISMGVQSFDNDILAYMGRVHSRQDTLDAIKQIRTAGIENIFIDLIYAYPNQSLSSWTENMLAAVNLDIEGYQLYRLRTKQHGDRQGNIIKQMEKNPAKMPITDDILLMKSLGILLSKAHGFDEHQTRIFAKNSYDISHYLRDWCCRLTDVVGIGVSSWSNIHSVFALNVGDQDLTSYYSLIDENKVAINRGKLRTRDDEVRRSFILPLKNMKVSKAFFQELIGVPLEIYFAEQINYLKGLHLLDENDSHVWLTDSGRFFADEVCTQFFNPDYLPFPEVMRIPKAAFG